MTVAAAFRAGVADFYRQTWRLALLNLCVAVSLAAVVAAALFVRIALVLAVFVGPLVTMLMRSCLKLLESHELDLRDALAALQQTWRRGLSLGVLVVGALLLGIVATPFYAGFGVWAWPLAALTLYVVAAFFVLQVALWPLAVVAPERPLLDAVRDAAATVVRRPLGFAALGAALMLVNLLGVLLGILPFLILTIAYSCFVSARFVLPYTEPEAEPWRVSPTTT